MTDVKKKYVIVRGSLTTGEPRNRTTHVKGDVVELTAKQAKFIGREVVKLADDESAKPATLVVNPADKGGKGDKGDKKAPAADAPKKGKGKGKGAPKEAPKVEEVKTEDKQAFDLDLHESTPDGQPVLNEDGSFKLKQKA